MDRLTKWLGQLGIPRRDCDADTARQHLAVFVDAFVVAASRARVHNLLQRRERWSSVAQPIQDRLDPKLCAVDAAQSRPNVWRPQFVADGIYLGQAFGLHMHLQQASALSIATCDNAVFSIEPGRRAVLLDHEWGVWYCSRTGPQ